MDFCPELTHKKGLDVKKKPFIIKVKVKCSRQTIDSARLY